MSILQANLRSRIMKQNKTDILENWEDELYNSSESSGIDEVYGDGKVRVTYILEDVRRYIQRLLEAKDAEHKEKMREAIEEAYGAGIPGVVFDRSEDSHYRRLFKKYGVDEE